MSSQKITKMKKATQLYIVDAILAIAFILTGVTGIMKMPSWFSYSPKVAIPLMKIHDISGIVMVVLVGVHLIQHWKWIVAMTKNLIIQNKKVKNIMIIVLVMIITTILSLTVYSITSKENSIETETQTEKVQDFSDVTTGGCPFGIVDDEYPGSCGLYKDENHNNECDYGE
jgi:uncharacterized membrane protein YhdT